MFGHNKNEVCIGLDACWVDCALWRRLISVKGCCRQMALSHSPSRQVGCVKTMQVNEVNIKNVDPCSLYFVALEHPKKRHAVYQTGDFVTARVHGRSKSLNNFPSSNA